MSSSDVAYRSWQTEFDPRELPIKITESERKTLSDILREARKATGVSQAELAAQLGMPQSFVSKYESGERRLDLLELHKICLALNIPLKDLAGRIEKQLTKGK